MDEERMMLELLAAARGAGIEIREDSLSSGDLKAGSDLVMLKGSPVLFLDKNLAPAERAGLIARALRSIDLENVYLSPAARSMIENAEAVSESADHGTKFP